LDFFAELFFFIGIRHLLNSAAAGQAPKPASNLQVGPPWPRLQVGL
jgi:hypothetical protein